MDFLGVGPLELIAILLILFIVMGPGDLVKMGATFGRALRNLRQSDTWRTVQQATRELRSLPATLARQANLEDLEEIKKGIKEDLQAPKFEGLKEVKNEIQRDLDAPKAAIDDLDRQFVAWTRQNKATPKGGKKESDGPKDESEKAN